MLAHINDRPRRKVAESAGISMDTMYRLVRKHGGELRHDLSTKREGIEDTVRRYYPDMTAKEQTVWRMVRKRNYFQVEGEPFTLYYDGETNRVPTEARLSKKYGLHFVAADDYEEQQNLKQE